MFGLFVLPLVLMLLSLHAIGSGGFKLSRRVIPIQETSSLLFRRSQKLRMASNFPSRSNISFSDIQSLLTDIVDIVRTTGVRSGISRTVQATQAVAAILQSFIQNPNIFRDSDSGNILPERIIKSLFERLGATYIKLGQFIASSPTLFPAEYVREFQSCLDNTPRVPYSEIRKIIQEDLKRPVSAVFSEVDPVPIASASIAQVHRGRLRNGTEVVIKVRKPTVEETLKADLGFLL